MSGPIRVVVCEDSELQRAHLVRLIEQEQGFVVVGQASDAEGAVAAVAETRPDVVTMDLEMPGSGTVAIEQIMATTPVPILVISGVIDGAGSARAIEALAAGAVEALPKPLRWTDAHAEALRRQLRVISTVSVISRRPPPPRLERPSPVRGRRPVVALAASTGGPAALSTVLSELGPLGVPVLLVQHIHPSFINGFVSWLATVTNLDVVRAEDGDRARPGFVYVAPAYVHLRLRPDGRLSLDPEPVRINRPSADELFASVAASAGPAAVAALLTGMGEDGARGLFEVRAAGGTTIVQDEATSTVYGMPAAAMRLGASEHTTPLEQIAAAIRGALVRRPA